MKYEGFKFNVAKRLHKARLSELVTPHGVVRGPFFQFVATQAAIRGQVFSEDLEKLGVQIVLANTYHLHLRPGEDTVAEAGGLHQLMQWNGPMTTDSGGYQVFSLGDNVKLDAEGVTFRSPLDGDEHRLTPESAIKIQTKLGADIIMPLDVCTPFGVTHEEVAGAVEQTLVWAKRCQEEHERIAGERKLPQALYGIVQGGVYPDLRERAAQGLQDIGFFGYSVGGELRDAESSAVETGVAMTIRHLPQEAPRYVMGSGSPEDVVRLVRLGVDQFDCVLPIRNARHGKLYRDLNEEELTRCLQDPEYSVDPERLYREINIRKSGFARDWNVLFNDHPVVEKAYTYGYLHHLMRTEAPSGFRLAVLNNIDFYVRLFGKMREIISQRGE